MKNKQKYINFTVLILAVISATIWLSATTNAGNKRSYEIRQNISVPLKQSDTVAVVNSYESLMHRYIALSENSMTEMGKNSDIIITKLDSMDKKIDDLAARLERIEEALNIPKDLPKPETPKVPKPETPEMPEIPEPEIPEV